MNRATATLATLASPQTAQVGDTIVDTVTVTGVTNGPAPISGVVFTVHADPPGAAPCSGPPQDAGFVGLTPAGGSPPTSTASSSPVTVTTQGTYRFRVTYGGDANYDGLPFSPCGAPGENVTVNPRSGRYTSPTPARILDTRTGIGGVSVPIGPGASTGVQVTGQGGVPATGVTAVAMNVAVTQPTSAGYLTIYPSGEARPLAANLNFTAGQTVSNLVVVMVGTDGRVDAFNSAGSTEVIFDVAGWFSNDSAGGPGRFAGLVPTRILDTRTGTGGSLVRLGPGATLDLQVAG